MKRLKYKKGRKVVSNYFEYTGNHREHPVELQLFVYNAESYTETKNLSFNEEEVKGIIASDDVKWLNIHGLHDVEVVKKVVESIGIDSYIAGDILNVSKRTRMEELNNS